MQLGFCRVQLIPFDQDLHQRTRVHEYERHDPCQARQVDRLAHVRLRVEEVAAAPSDETAEEVASCQLRRRPAFTGDGQRPLGPVARRLDFVDGHQRHHRDRGGGDLRLLGEDAAVIAQGPSGGIGHLLRGALGNG